MSADATFCREAGSGPGVVCLHANAGSSSQWRALMDLLAPRHRVLAPDGHGAGKGPAWPLGRTLTLRDEVALVQRALDRAGDRFALVGHSYGGAVALMAALAQPARVRALVLYEPTLFALVEAEAADEVAGIRGAVAAAGRALDAGDADGAARCFIDFWMGDGAWAATPAARRTPIVGAIAHVRGWAQALFGEPTPLAAFAALRMPVLLLSGSASPPSALAVLRRLQRVLPHAETVRFEGVGHMGPVTHPETVNATIAAFLERC